MTEEQSIPTPKRRGRPPKAAAPSPEQKRIADLEAQIAEMRKLLEGKAAAPPEDIKVNNPRQPHPQVAMQERVERARTHLIHFTRPGFTAFGTVWDAGQEIEIQEGSPHWEMTVDRTGQSWVTLSEREQVQRYGDVYFRPGEWHGKKLSDLTIEDFEQLEDAPITQADLDRLILEERRRGRSIPFVSTSEYEIRQN